MKSMKKAGGGSAAASRAKATAQANKLAGGKGSSTVKKAMGGAAKTRKGCK